MSPHRIAAGLAGLALGGMLAACSGTAASGYTPITAAQTPAPVAAVPSVPTSDATTGATDGATAATDGATGDTGAPAGAAPAGTTAGTAPDGTAAGTQGTHASGTVATTTPQVPTNYAALARQFVTLRNQGTSELAAVKGQASSSDLNADKKLFSDAATIFGNYATQLLALPFPASMRADAQTLAKAVSAVQSTFVQASQVQSFDALNPILQQLVNERDDQLNATNAVEHDLGLTLSTPDPGY